jgi:hypothetical protein
MATMLHILPTGEGELTPREVAAWATRIRGFEGLLAAGLVAPEESQGMFERLRMDMGTMGRACAQALATRKPVTLCLADDPLQGAECEPSAEFGHFGFLI